MKIHGPFAKSQYQSDISRCLSACYPRQGLDLAFAKFDIPGQLPMRATCDSRAFMIAPRIWKSIGLVT